MLNNITVQNTREEDITRYIIGAGAAFGMLSLGGAAMMKVNNSAFIKSLGKEWAKKYDWKTNTGSILGTNTALTKSQLLRQSQEEFERLAKTRETQAALRNRRKGQSFIDKMLRDKERHMNNLREEANLLEESTKQLEREIGEEKLRLPSSQPIGIDRASYDKFKELYRKLNKKLEPILKYERMNKTLKSRMGELYNEMKSIKRFNQQETRTIGQLTNLDRTETNKIEARSSVNKRQTIANKLQRMKDLRNHLSERLSDPNFVRRNKNWIEKELKITLDLDERGATKEITNIANTQTTDPLKRTVPHKVKEIEDMINITKTVPQQLDYITKLQSDIDELSRSVGSQLAYGNETGRETQRIGQQLNILEDFKAGNSSFDDTIDAIEKIRNTTSPVPNRTIDSILSNLNNNKKSLWNSMKRIIKSNKFTDKKYASKIEKILNKPNVKINEMLEILVNHPLMALENMNRNTIKAIEREGPGGSRLSRNEINSIKNTLKKMRSRITNNQISSEMGFNSRSKLSHEIDYANSIIDRGNTHATNLNTMGVSSHDTGMRPIIADDISTIDADGFIKFDPSDTNVLNNMKENIKYNIHRKLERIKNRPNNNVYSMLMNIDRKVSKGLRLTHTENALLLTQGININNVNAGVTTAKPIENKFVDTIFGENIGVKNVRKSLANKLGVNVNEINTSIKANSGNETMTLRLSYQHSGTSNHIDIDLPNQYGNLLSKNDRLHSGVPTVKYQGPTGIVKSPIVSYMEYVDDQIKNYNSGMTVSLETEEMKTAFNKLQNRITGKYGELYGKQGAAGSQVVDIADDTTFEQTKKMSMVDNISIKRKTSKQMKQNLNFRYTQLQAQLTSLENTQAPLNRKIQILDELNRVEQEINSISTTGSFESGIKSIRQSHYSNVLYIDGTSYNLDTLYNKTLGTYSLEAIGVSAEKIPTGRNTSIDFQRAFLGDPDPGRGTKYIYNILDNTEAINTKIYKSLVGTNNKLSLTLGEKAEIKAMTLANKHKQSPIFQHVKKIHRKGTKRLELLQKKYNDWFKHGKEFSNRDTWGKHFLKMAFDEQKMAGSYEGVDFNSYFRDVAEKGLKNPNSAEHGILREHLIKIIRKRKHLLKSIDPKYYSGDILENISRHYKKYSSVLFGKPLDEVVKLDPSQIPNKAINFMNQQTMDIVDSHDLYFTKPNGEKVYNTSAFNIKQTNMLMVDAPMMGDGITYHSNSGIKKHGVYTTERSTKIKLDNVIKKYNNLLEGGNIRAGKYQKNMKDILEKLVEKTRNSGKESWTLERLKQELKLNKQQYDEFVESIQKGLNKGDFIPNQAVQQHLKAGISSASLSEIKINPNNKTFNIKYNYHTEIAAGTKIGNEYQGKLMNNLQFDDATVKNIQRNHFMKGYKDYIKSLIGENTQESKTIERIANNITEDTMTMNRDADWREFQDALKTSSNRAVGEDVRTKLNMISETSRAYGNNVYDTIISTKSRLRNKGKSYNLGKVQALVSDVWNTSLPNVDKNTAEGRQIYKELMSSIYEGFDQTDVKLEVKHSTTGVIIDNTNKSTANLQSTLPNIKEISRDANKSNQYKKRIEGKVKNVLSNHLANNAEINRAVKKVMSHVNLSFETAKVGIMERVINNEFVLHQDMFELNRVTNRNSYTTVKGFKEGAKLNILDALSLRMQGLTHTSNKLMTHYKQGIAYTQMYIRNVLESLGLNPNNFTSDPLIKNMSGRLRNTTAAGEASKQVLFLKQAEAKSRYSWTNGLSANNDTLVNMLNLSDEEAEILNKGIISRQFMEDIDSAEIHQITNDVPTNEENLRATMHDQHGDDLIQWDRRKLIGNIDEMDAATEAKKWLAASARLKEEDIGKYQKLSSKFKSISFTNIDTGTPYYSLHHNANRGRKIYGINLLHFGMDMDYNPEIIQNLPDEQLKGKYEDIATVERGTIDNAPNSRYVRLNRAHQSQLALTAAINSGASKETIEILYNTWRTSVAQQTKTLMTNVQKKGTPATVSGAGRGTVQFNVRKMNAWGVVGEMKNIINSTDNMSNYRQFLPSNIKNASKKDLISKGKRLIGELKREGGDKWTSFKNKLQERLLGDKMEYAAPGEVIMSENRIQQALTQSFDNASTQKVGNIMRKLYTGELDNFMSLGIRFPTLRPLNKMPLSVIPFDHKILDSEDGLGLLQDLTGTADYEAAMKATLDRGMGEDAFVMNMVDAKLMGGDLDRDMFYSILALDDKYGPGGTYQKELKAKFNNQLNITVKSKDIDGRSVYITTRNTDTTTRSGDILERLERTWEQKDLKDIRNGKIPKGRSIKADGRQLYNKYINDGLSDEAARERTIDDIMKEVGTEEDKVISVDISEKETTTVFTGNERRLLASSELANDTVSNISLTNRWTESTEYRNAVLESMKEHNIGDVDEIIKISTDTTMSGNQIETALIDRKTKLESQIDETKRALQNMGYSPSEIEMEVAQMKKVYANETADNIINRSTMANQHQLKLNRKLSKSSKRMIPEISGSALALKSLTGQVYNSGKYLMDNIAMTVFGAQSKKTAMVSEWTGNLGQANISAKHKIPLITEDVVSTLRSISNPNSSQYEKMMTSYSARTGDYRVFQVAEEISNIESDIKRVGDAAGNKNLNLKTRRKLKVKQQRLSNLHDNITKSGEFRVSQYQSYIDDLLDISGDINMSASEVAELNKVRAATEKARKFGTALTNVEDLGPRLQQMVDTGGYSDFLDMMNAPKVLTSNRGLETQAEEAKFYRSLTKLNKNYTAQGTALNNVFTDQANSALKNIGKTASLYHTENIYDSFSRSIGTKLKNKVNNSRLSNIIDADSFTRLKGGGLIGLAAVGFIGAFGVASSRRDWLGPTEGYGGEAAENRINKDEERLSNMNLVDRLKDRNVVSGPLHTQRPNMARLKPPKITPGEEKTIGDQMREIANVGEMDKPMRFHRFN